MYFCINNLFYKHHLSFVKVITLKKLIAFIPNQTFMKNEIII